MATGRDPSRSAQGAKPAKPVKKQAARASAPRAAASPKPTAGEIARSAVAQLVELVGQEVEGVTGLERIDDGWKIQVELLELRRVPSTTDVLATYEVEVDDRGALQGYRRVERYSRGDTRSDG